MTAMSETSSAFAFWKDRDQLDDPAQTRKPPSPPSRGAEQLLIKAYGGSVKLPSEKPPPPRPPPRPPNPPAVPTNVPRGPAPGSPLQPVTPPLQSSVRSRHRSAKVPLLPPSSSWTQRETLLDGPRQADTGAKVIAMTTSLTNKSGLYGDKSTSKQDSGIIRKLTMDCSPPTRVQGGPEKYSRMAPHSVPATTTDKRFMLPPNSSRGITRWEGGEMGEGVRKEDGGELKRASRSVERKGRGASVREELKRRRELTSSSMRVKTEDDVMGEGDNGEGEVRRGGRGEGDSGRERVVEERRESRSLSGSKRRESGSMKIKSSWTCYLDGPENSQALSAPPAPTSPRHHSPSHHTPSIKPSHTPLSHSPSSSSLIQSFSESFRISTSDPAHNYLRNVPPFSKETQQFWTMVDRLRRERECPSGHLTSPLLSTSQPLSPSPSLHQTITSRRGTIAKKTNGGHVITVSMVTNYGDEPVTFQCNAQLTVCDVIEGGVAKEGKGRRSSDNLWLKVCGRDEYLTPVRRLIDYVYVHNCLKLYAEVKVQIIGQAQLPKSLACEPLATPLPPPPGPAGNESVQLISAHELNNLIDSYITKEDKFAAVMRSHTQSPSPVPIPALAQTVISCVKLLCERLLYIEPPSLSDAIYDLRRLCKSLGHHDDREGVAVGVGGDGDDDNVDTSETALATGLASGVAMTNDDDVITTTDSTQDIISGLSGLRQAVQYLVSLYTLSLHPGYLPLWWVEPKERVPVSTQTRSLRVKVCALHRISLIEVKRFSQFQLEVCVYHGGLPLSKRTYSPPAKITRSFFSTIVWNKWLNFGVPLSHLPREARLCVTLHGLEASGTTDNPWNRSPVAWVTQRLFNSEGVLIFGPRLLGLWEDDVADPLGSPYPNTTSSKAVLLELMFEDSGERVICDEPPPCTPPAPSSPPAHPGPPPSIYRGLKKMADRDRFSSLSMEDEKLIWTNRFLLQAHLGSSPRGLPLLLLSTPHWHSPHRDDVWAVLGAWPCNDPVHGLELLDAQLADSEVRKTAVYWLSGLPDDDLCDYLPQLVQSLRHDCYEASGMARLLLERALLSPRLSHHLYWQLRVLATGQGERYAVRYQHMLQALEIMMGETLKNEFNTQVELVDQLVAVAAVVKATRDAHRQTVLVQELQRVGERFVGEFRLPLSPSLLVKGLDIESSSFFNSNTVPLKLSFLNSDPAGENIDIIFKVGDDLRQDILVLQMIKLMEKIWLRAGLDLKMITYDCVATGYDQGMLELVTDAATLRAIQTEHGVTGSFKDKPLSDWLMRYNTSESAYRKAVDNFTHSCAGYCVATYVLGICDRHNDNIMVKKSGHMFHIDFGKILGNAQMFGSIKRDRVPFVLTRDMAYVINDGDRPTSRFQQFVDLCCTAYNEIRRHTHTFLSLLSLMLPSGLAELTSADDVRYVRDALLPGRSDAEATYAFTKHIEDSLGSVATQINFFIHNIAQLKFSSPQAPPTLLSFVPQAYSIETDGQIQSAVVVAYYMRYYPDTYTVYQIQVTRAQVGVTTLFRRYREFDELHGRLGLCFPGDNLPTFPGKTYLPGKSRTRETAEKRLIDLNKYINELLSMEARISESDVVYTFFHCLVRDEQDKTKMEEEGTNEGGTVAGRVKVHLMYDRRSQSLDVMIRHVKDLIAREGSDSADPYVKLYLKPDPTKTTKQKTKTARRTLHPTYNETFTYKVPPLVLGHRSLELSVWDASILLNKQCLAVATIELSTLQSELGSGCGYWVELHSPT